MRETGTSGRKGPPATTSVGWPVRRHGDDLTSDAEKHKPLLDDAVGRDVQPLPLRITSVLTLWIASLVGLAGCSNSPGSSTPAESVTVTTNGADWVFSQPTALAIMDCYHAAQDAGTGWLNKTEEALATCERAQVSITADHVPDDAEPEAAIEANVRSLTAALRQAIARAPDGVGVSEDDSRAVRAATKQLKAEAGEYL